MAKLQLTEQEGATEQLYRKKFSCIHSNSMNMLNRGSRWLVECNYEKGIHPKFCYKICEHYEQKTENNE